MGQYFTTWDESYNTFRTFSLYNNNTAQLNQLFNDNFDQKQMRNYQINMVALYFANRTLFRSRTYDTSSSTVDAFPIPSELSSFPFSSIDNFNLPSARALNFISIKSTGKIYMVISNPIQTSFFEGPIYVISVFAKEVSPILLQDFATRSQLCISIYSYNNASQNATLESLNLKFTSNITLNYQNRDWVEKSVGTFNVLSKDSEKSLLQGRYCSSSNTTAPVETISQDNIAGYNLYSDLSGGYTTVIRFDQTRPLQTLSQSLIALMVGLLCAVAVVTFIVVLILLIVLVIYKLFSLTKQIRNIWVSEDYSQKVDVFGDKDEVGILAGVINNMLDTINISKQKISAFAEKLGREQEKIKTFLNVLPDAITIIRPTDGTFYYINQTFIKSFGYSMNDLEKKTIESLIPESKTDDVIKGGFETNVVSKEGVKSRCDVISSVVDIEEDGRTQTLYVVVLRKKETEEESLKQQNKELVERNKLLLFEESYKDEALRVAYRKYLTKLQFSTSGIDFLDDIQKYKSLDQFNRSEMLKLLLEKYFSENAPKLQLSQDEMISLKKDLESGLGESKLFSRYENQIKLKLINESFTRFESEYSEKMARKQSKTKK